MAKVDETQQGVHPFTLDWWRGLPECYRTADRAQGYHITEAWAGYNADPRFITGWDSWDRTNTSTEPWVSSLGLTRRFRVEPGAPVLIRTWHHPTFNTHDPATTAIVGDAVVGDMILGLSPGELTVGHRVRNHTGTVVAETVQTLTGEGYVDTWVTPDRFGTLHVSVNVAIPVPDSSNLIRAVHVGTNEPDFGDLPDITDFTVARAYPLLRFMDGIGYQGGHLRDTAEQMHDGAWTNPYEAPTIALPYLAAVLGLPTEYGETLTGDQLRAHLVGMVESGLPATGSRPAIEAVAKQWLTGDRQVAIIPAHTMTTKDLDGDKAALVASLGMDDGTPTTVHVQKAAPLDGLERIQWTGTSNASPSTWTLNGVTRYENLVPNPSFRYGVGQWSVDSGTVTHDTTRGDDDTRSGRLDFTTATTLTTDTETRIPATEQSYTLTARIYTTTTGVQCATGIRGYNADGGVTGNTNAGPVPIPVNTWTTVQVQGNPGATAEIRPRITVTAPSTGVVWVDTVSMSRATHTAPAYFDGDSSDPTPPFWHDVWVTPGGDAHTWDGATWVEEPAVHATAEKVALGGVTREDLHTLVLLVRADEVPNGDMPAFQRFLNNSGVVPAGHALIATEASQDWGTWQQAVGETWASMQKRAPRWVDHRSIGIEL